MTDDEREAAKAAREAAREAAKAAREAAREKAKLERELRKDAAELERERIREEADSERERVREEAEAERERIRDEAEAARERVRADLHGDPHADHWEERWERRARANWERQQRAWRKHQEHHARWEARHQKHKQRWKRLHEEREMWMRADRRSWWPWWLQARMRRRIFTWLAIAFVVGVKFGVSFWHELHWWHGVIIVCALSAMSGAIAFRLTRPLLIAIRAAQDIGDGKLETRVAIEKHGGETRILGVAINDMAERIQQQLSDQRQLLAAVSHELRTPLGHMRVLIETARDTGDPKSLAELEREVLVLDDLVGRLLAQSRLEFGTVDRRPVDLGQLVTDCATSAGIAPEAIEAIGDVTAAIDPTLVRRAIANLIDNARVHGGGAVAVRIERRAAQVAIEVDDAGPGVPADRRADAFRAFVPSRAGGLGLGLALVSRIAVAHGGGAWIADRPGGGARVGFTVSVEAPPAS